MVRTTTSRAGNWSISPMALGRSENSAYASSTTTIPGAALISVRMSCSGSDPPVGLFGLVMNSTSGACSATSAAAAIDVDAEVGPPRGRDPFGPGPGGDDRVHRVRRLEPQRRASGPGERLQQLQQDLVGPVGRPHVRTRQVQAGGSGQVVGQLFAQRHRVPIRVPVQLDRRRGHRRRQVSHQGSRRGIRVLVGVDLHRDVQLRRTVGRAADQIRAQRQIRQRHLEADHASSPGPNRADTASPCAGRSSASDSASTCGATCDNAARE